MGPPTRVLGDGAAAGSAITLNTVAPDVTSRSAPTGTPLPALHRVGRSGAAGGAPHLVVLHNGVPGTVRRVSPGCSKGAPLTGTRAAV